MAYDFLSLIASDCLPHQVTLPPLEHGWLFLMASNGLPHLR